MTVDVVERTKAKLPYTPDVIGKKIPELIQLERLIERGKRYLRTSCLTQVKVDDQQLPIYFLKIGSDSPTAPALGLFGGVHGVERIGAEVVIAYLETLVERLRWDQHLLELLEKVTLFAIPIVNPAGMWNNSRCNGRGVDLMRNAPVESDEPVPFLAGGQRLSRHLPWYRGRSGSEMEPELQALYDTVRQESLSRPFLLTLDCHSGFGLKDRVWFPYAKSRKPLEDIGICYRLYRLFDRTYRNHTFYVFEPQSKQYTTHGDVWDLLYDEAREGNSDGTFLPLTLEMGSWLWVKKNPKQLLRFSGIFHPTVPHRHSRILRRHYPFLDFLLAVTCNHQEWQRKSLKKKGRDTKAALRLWFPDKGSQNE